MMSGKASARNWRQFTLLELLIVIGIIMIMLGITMPAFRNMASGNAVNVTASTLIGQLNLARAAAISEQKYIAVIMPGRYFVKPNGTGTSSETVDEYNFKSYRIGIVTPDNAQNKFHVSAWYPGSAWKFLPNGAVIAEANNEYKHTGTSASAGREMYGSDRLHNVVNNTTDSQAWLGGTDHNQLNGDSTGNSTWVVDGDYSANGGEVRLADNKDNNTATANARCVVFSPRGRCCTVATAGAIVYEDRYITIVEGNVENAGSNTYQISEANINNMLVIKVSGTTGRCEMIKPTNE